MGFNITHITVHLGGGIGTVIMNWIENDKKNNHTILCLSNTYEGKFCNNSIAIENVRHDKDAILAHTKNANIIILHFWNHPYLYEFLTRNILPPCRLCIWSHVSGFYPPYIFPHKLIALSDKFIFGSPISYSTSEILSLSKKEHTKLSCVWTTGDITEYFKVKKKKHSTFNIGYIGTLDFSKMSPNFIGICSKIDIPNAKFFIIGDGYDKDTLKQQVKDKKLQDKFIFTGLKSNIKQYLAIIDIFGYPLNSSHFGTCEQVLGESIAAGIIPVVLNNAAEKHILYNSLLKVTCASEKEYIDTIKLLYKHKQEIPTLVKILQENILILYNTKKMVSDWNKIFIQIIKKRKTRKIWSPRVSSGKDIFIESLGNYGDIFKENKVVEIKKLFNSNLQWKSESKGSIKQYLKAFPEDEKLREWRNLC